MIELTLEQVREFGTPEPRPLRVINPATREEFVLMPVVEYERLIDEERYDDCPWTDAEREQLRLEACEMLDSFRKNT